MTRNQLLAVLERAVKTVAQTMVGLLVASGSVGIYDVDWAQALNVGLMAGALSLLTSAASWGVGEPGPSAGGRTFSTEGGWPPVG